MKRMAFLGLAAGTIVAVFFLAGCNSRTSCLTRPDLLTATDLSAILEADWQQYKSTRPNFTGGLAMQILSPKGDYFISTGMGDVTAAHHFRIASITKTFTAAGIMLLNQKRLLNIDDKITDNIPGTNIPYVPDTADYDIPYKNDITIRMLLMHRAGIFDVSNNDIPDNEFSRVKPYVGQSYLDYMENKDKKHTFTFDELVGVVAQNKLSFFVPGTSYHYSDTGYSILGKIIERVSGKSYSDFIRDELLVPNGLPGISSPWKGSEQTLPPPFIKGYVWINAEAQEVTESNMSPHVAEGNLTATFIDLANWCRKLFTGNAGLSKETVEMMKSGMAKGDGTAGTYGLGIGYSKETGYGHSGAHAGYLTTMLYDPNHDVAYVIFTNTWDLSNNLDSLMAELKFMTGAANKILRKIGY